MAEKKGRFVIKNSEGVVTLAGSATALTNDAMTVTHTDGTEVSEHRDAGNVPRSFTRDFLDYRMTLRLTPGVGAAHIDQATVKTGAKTGITAGVANLAKMDSIVTSGFEDDAMNWSANEKGFIEEVGKTLAQGDLYSIDVTARRLALTDGTALDFSAAWAAL